MHSISDLAFRLTSPLVTQLYALIGTYTDKHEATVLYSQVGIELERSTVVDDQANIIKADCHA